MYFVTFFEYDELKKTINYINNIVTNEPYENILIFIPRTKTQIYQNVDIHI